MTLSFTLTHGLDDIIDLQDHLHYLGSQLQLSFLGKQGLKDLHLLHIGVTSAHAVNTEIGIAGVGLLSFGLGQHLQGI